MEIIKDGTGLKNKKISMKIHKMSDSDIVTNFKGIQEHTLWEYKSSLELIANQAINMTEPDTIKQARDNLLGLARLILSSCSRHDIKVR